MKIVINEIGNKEVRYRNDGSNYLIREVSLSINNEDFYLEILTKVDKSFFIIGDSIKDSEDNKVQFKYDTKKKVEEYILPVYLTKILKEKEAIREI